MLKKFYKPEYFYQPFRLFARIQYFFFPPNFGMQNIRLSWGRNLTANPAQTIGRSLSTFGLYDLALSEMIYRLVRPGDTVIDVGANIGYTTCLMLDCLQGQGQILSFEPLPELFSVLKENVGTTGDGVAELKNVALSDQVGEAVLTLPVDFGNNDGIATLQKTAEGKKITVPTSTIDALNISHQVRLMKLDVEGHELSVLKGAEESLKKDLFEYIIFEDLEGYKGKTSKFLEEKGYKIYKLIKGFTGLSLREPEFEHYYSYEPDNFLATKDLKFCDKINQHAEWKIFSWKPNLK